MNPTKKDVIYVDIEDDITAIIDKVKSAQAPIVALVPPKRIGVLQSVVNLKLLMRAASSADKRIVLITSDTALLALAAGVSIPVARNLQSKPEVSEITARAVDDEEVINGEELPVGDLARTAPETVTPTPGQKIAATTPFAVTAAAKAPKKGAKLPDFDTFRKKLFLGIGGGALLLVFLIWAIFFAPQATVAITANTNLQNITQTLQLRPGAALDTGQNILPAAVQQIKKTTSVDFDPTGKKDVGEKAKGTIKFSTDSISVASKNPTIPAGTTVTSAGGIAFTTDESVTLSLINSSDSTGVTAVNSGTGSNGVSGTASGAPNGVSASFVGTTAGGTDKTIAVVSNDDVTKAREQLQAQDANAVLSELKKKFAGDILVINESYKAEPADPVSAPRVGEEAPGRAKLTVETTYTLVGIRRADLKANFDAYLSAQLAGKDNQKVYASGDESASFSQFATVEGGYTVIVNAQAQVGPQINETELKKQLAGKRAGEIQQQLDSIDGIEDVQTSFFPFWVTKAPAENRITIKFVLKNGAN